jgi:hypothetical protein
MKKYLLPSVLILIGFLGYALAQSITKSVQLSQDPTGTIGYDTNNNVYFPAHINNNGPGIPTVATSAGTAPTINANSTDNQGIVTGGAASTQSVTIVFNKAYLAAPACVVVPENPSTSPLAYNVVATGINITSGVGAAIVNYLCMGAK